MIVRVSDKLLYCSGEAAPPASPEPCPVHDSEISGRGACTCYDVPAAPAPVGPDAELIARLIPQFPIIVHERGTPEEDVIENYYRAEEFIALVIREARK